MHSSFLVEIKECFLLFDYFDGTKVPAFNRSIKLPTISGKPIFAFASHSHKDHYDISLLKLKEKYPDITFILSKDIRLGENFMKRNGINPALKSEITFVKPGNHYEVKGLKIDTLHSSDSGVAFVINAFGKKIYHGGDLNWWHWDTMTQKEQAYEEMLYKTCIDPIRGMHFDVAMVPKDPRLGDAAALGFDYFLEIAGADNIYPMHMWN